MDNTELLQQIVGVIEQSEQRMVQKVQGEIEQSEQRMVQRMQGFETEMLTRMKAFETHINVKIDSKMQEFETEMKAFETRINIKLENEVTKRIDSLFDGYQLTHEKQWELSHRVDQLEARLSRLEAVG